jgi:peptidoglycan/xylan/chitin deacetylase (PgdA/CDA1 family)
MRPFSLLLKHGVYLALSKSGYLRRAARPGPVVVTYHGVVPPGYKPTSEALDGHLVTAEMFRQHMRLLKSKYNLISPQEFLSCLQGKEDCPPGSVLLTCDDGLLNVLTEMLPIIAEFELRFLLFLTAAAASEGPSMLWYEKLNLWLNGATRTARVELPGGAGALTACPGNPDAQWRPLIRILSRFQAGQREELLSEIRTQLGISETWDSEYSQNESLRRRFLTLNASQSRELARKGATIGSHTLSHPMLSQASEELAYTEMAESRIGLENATGEPVWALAYPFGDAESVGVREPELARRAGFQCAFVNTESETGDAYFAVPRIHVSSRTSVAELEAHVSGFYRSLRAML